MTAKDRAFLIDLCAALTKQFPHVTAGFEGFAAGYLGGEQDGFLTVEVFGVPEGDLETVLTFGEQLTGEHLMAGGTFVIIRPWTVEETEASFSAEVARLRGAGA